MWSPEPIGPYRSVLADVGVGDEANAGAVCRHAVPGGDGAGHPIKFLVHSESSRKRFELIN